MAEENETIVTVTTVEGQDVQINVTEEAQKLANKAVRDYADSVKGENVTMRGGLMGTYLSEIGLDASTGLGKAIAKEYEGAIDQETVASYAAEEYGYSHNVEAGETAEPNEQAAQITAATEQVAQTDSVSAPVTPATSADQLAEADQKLADAEATPQDAQAAAALKLAAYLQAQGR